MRLGVPARIGVVSDTHGMLDPRVLEVFEGADAIIHAGDIGSPAILMELEALAPLVAVRGNTDEARWAEDLPLVATVRIGAHLLEVSHLGAPPRSDEVTVAVAGHTHRPSVERIDGRLYINPGSASRPRGPEARATVAVLDVVDAEVHVRIEYL